jgi:GAF domain-containing protein
VHHELLPRVLVPKRIHRPAVILGENRPAALNNTSLRQDLKVPAVAGVSPIRAVLGAPVRVAEQPAGVFAIYSTRELDWGHEQFRLAEWLVDQCGHVPQASRAQEALRGADQQKVPS